MNITMCIPRIENTTELNYVRSIFSKLNIGNIQQIFEIPLRANVEYKRVMIQMDINDNDEKGSFILNRLRGGKDVKIVYKNACYWKVFMGRENKKTF
jgi:hypothetical protein